MMVRLVIICLICSSCSFTPNQNDHEWRNLIKLFDSEKVNHLQKIDGFTLGYRYNGKEGENKAGVFICMARKINKEVDGVNISSDSISYFLVDKRIMESVGRHIIFHPMADSCNYTKPLPDFEVLQKVGIEVTNNQVLTNGKIFFYECGKELILEDDYKSTVGVNIDEWKHGFSRGGIITKNNIVIYWLDAW